MHGDELRIRYVGEMHKAWSGVGHVIKIPDSILGPLAGSVFVCQCVCACMCLCVCACACLCKYAHM